MVYIIGVGGVGSWLSQTLVRLASNPKNVCLVDGDTLEEKNLDRQLFSTEAIGKNKAEAMGEMLSCVCYPEWFSPTMADFGHRDWLMCCVDNNPGRKAVLQACDMFGCSAILASNETHSSEAYVYQPGWKGHPALDPRIKYAPKIETDSSGNPQAASIGCTGEAQIANRQLVTANVMAAAMAAHLFVLWAMESPKIKPELQAHFPFRLFNNLTRNGCVLKGELTVEEAAKKEVYA